MLRLDADAGLAHVPVPQLKGEQLPYLLGPVLSPGAVVRNKGVKCLRADEARTHELSSDEDVVYKFPQVACATHALKGAEKEAFGRLMISSGSHTLAACLRATFPLRPETLWSPASENAALNTTGSTKGTRTSVDAAMLALSV